MVVCSACGHENQDRDNFCVLCGTPLSHGNGGPIEMPTSKSLSTEEEHSAALTRPGEMVPEIPLDEYVKSFRYAPPSEPTEITMRGDAQVLQPEASSVTDTLPGAPPETSMVVEVNPIPAAEHVGEELTAAAATPAPSGDGATDNLSRSSSVNLHEQPPNQQDDVTTTCKTALHSERFDRALAPAAVPPEPIPAAVTDVPWIDVLEDFIIAVALGITAVLMFAGLTR